MSLSRAELLARGLVRAQEMSGSEVPLSSFLDNPHLSGIPLEDKVEALNQYASLSRSLPPARSSLKKEIVSGAMQAAGAAIPAAVIAGVLTGAFTPTTAAFKAAVKNKTAAKYLAGRILGPMALVGGVSALAGAGEGFKKGRAKDAANKYLRSISEKMSRNPDPVDRKVDSAALLMSAPHASRMFSSAQSIPNLAAQAAPAKAEQMMAGMADESFLVQMDVAKARQGDDLQSVAERDPSGKPSEVVVRFKHRDWKYIPGYGRVE